MAILCLFYDFYKCIVCLLLSTCAVFHTNNNSSVFKVILMLHIYIAVHMVHKWHPLDILIKFRSNFKRICFLGADSSHQIFVCSLSLQWQTVVIYIYTHTLVMLIWYLDSLAINTFDFYDDTLSDEDCYSESLIQIYSCY